MSVRRAAVVTGAGSGIGRATAALLAKRGMMVAMADINTEGLAAAVSEIEAAGGEALAIPCDVTDEGAVEQLMAQVKASFDRLDVLVCSVGVDLHKLLADTPIEDWRRIMDLNVTSAFLCMKHARDIMVENGYGRMVCLSSSSGIYGMGWPAYSTGKAALNGLALSAARELAPLGITVNTVAPGPTATPLAIGLWANNPGRKEQLEASVPVKRVAQPEEIAGAIGYLVSEEAGFVTGTTLVIDGGLTSLMPVAA